MRFKVVDIENDEFDERPVYNVLACIVSPLESKDVP
jgi:hypothetical protein